MIITDGIRRRTPADEKVFAYLFVVYLVVYSLWRALLVKVIFLIVDMIYPMEVLAECKWIVIYAYCFLSQCSKFLVDVYEWWLYGGSLIQHLRLPIMFSRVFFAIEVRSSGGGEDDLRNMFANQSSVVYLRHRAEKKMMLGLGLKVGSKTHWGVIAAAAA